MLKKHMQKKVSGDTIHPQILASSSCVQRYVQVPVMRCDQFGWVLQVLFETQFKGLADGADDFLG